MLDVRRFRTEFDVVRAGLARRGDDLSSLERVVSSQLYPIPAMGVRRVHRDLMQDG
jgi:hypothetical protein